MKNFWKWILGIVIVLVVLFGLGIGSHLLMRAIYPSTAVQVDGFTPPMMVRVDRPSDLEEFTAPMVIGGRGLVGIGMPHRSLGFMRLGLLVPLALIGLVIYGAYRLGTRRNTVVETPTVQTPVAQVRTCDKCGSIVQDGWNNCANCGRKL